MHELGNGDFYCLANKCWLGSDQRCVGAGGGKKINCGYMRRKHPTPGQFKEEYGREYPEDGAAYALLQGVKGWTICDYKMAKGFNEKSEPVVCACAPFGKPGDDWRPGP